MSIDEGGLKRRDVDGVADGKVHRRVDHVSECLLVVLDRTSLAVTVSEEDELLLLASPEGAHTLAIHLNTKIH